MNIDIELAGHRLVVASVDRWELEAVAERQRAGVDTEGFRDAWGRKCWRLEVGVGRAALVIGWSGRRQAA